MPLPPSVKKQSDGQTEFMPLPSDDEWEAMQRPVQVDRLSRDEFINEVFAPHYDPEYGHVAFIGPTRSGKTTLAYQLLDKVCSPELPGIVIVVKPKDQVVVDFSKLSGFKKTETWPPIWQRGWKQKSGGFGKKRRGWVFWPRHDLADIKRDNKKLSREIRKILNECYRRGNRLIFADEIVTLSKLFGLEEELDTVWREGGSMECPLWSATQRPFHAPLNMYSQSRHLFFFFVGDKRDRDRMKEIGAGVDTDLIESIILNLKLHECLYIGKHAAKDGVSTALAIIGAN